MRILICIIMVLFPTMTKTVANGVNELDYRFYVIPTVNPEIATFEIVLENPGDIPLQFEFPTSQLVEITISDSTGKEVYVYSKGRYFLQAFQTVSVEPNQTFRRTEKWNYQFKGSRVPPGEYTVRTTFRPIRLNDQPITDRSKLTNIQKIYIPEENPIFRKVKVSGTKGNYVITGEVKTESSEVYYSVEDGHREYIHDKKLDLPSGKAEWRPFQLAVHLTEGNLPQKGSLMINFYELSKEGKIFNPYPLLLEQFQ